jgi:ABC-type nitrate/sulfonate/bicarbonate transport system permease component
MDKFQRRPIRHRSAIFRRHRYDLCRTESRYHRICALQRGSWAFAWRSLISGEMIFVSLGLGQLLMMGRDLNDMSKVIAVRMLIIAIGYIVDGLVFKTIERRLQHKWGLSPA